MKIRAILFPVISALLASSPLAQAAPQSVAGRPVLWSVHLDVDRLRAGVGLDFIATLDAKLIPTLISSVEAKSGGLGGSLESLTFYGFPSPAGVGHENVPFLANLVFSPKGGSISKRFEDIRQKRGLSVEEIAGSPSLHFAHQGKEVWVVKLNDRQVVVGTSRDLLEVALKPQAGGIAEGSPPEDANDLFGGKVELKLLPKNNHAAARNSELMKMLSRVEFHFATNDKQLNLNAFAELDNERSAKRAARMIEGMVSAVAMEDKTGVPWDERLVLKQEGARLGMQVHLEPEEAKVLLDQVASQIRASYRSEAEDK